MLYRTQLFGHGRVFVATHSFDLFLEGRFGDLKYQRSFTEAQVFRGNKAIQKYVDA